VTRLRYLSYIKVYLPVLSIKKHNAKTGLSGSELLLSRLLKRLLPKTVAFRTTLVETMTIDIYYSVHTISFIASYKTKTKLLNRALCKPYRIGNRVSYQNRTCRFKYSKHFYSQSLTSREFLWLEPDKSCSCDFFEVVFHNVASPRITIENL